MSTDSITWRLAKLTSARDEAVRRLKLAVLRGSWRDAVIFAQQAFDADEAIRALAEEQRRPDGTAP